MDMLEISEKIPADQLAVIFRDFFNEHIAACYTLAGINVSDINVVTNNPSSIMYSVKMLDNNDKDKLVQHLSKLNINMYGKIYTPGIYVEGDLLCITIKK